MKLLADENTPRTIIEALRYSGYDILWVREYCPGMSDEEVICLSISENLIILTFDKDFGELVYRLGRIVDNQICQARVLELLSSYGNRLRGYFTVLTEGRIRRRSLISI